jgi:multiple sugar transport system ATP-binding protein
VLGPEQLAYVEIGARPVLVEEVLDGLVDQPQAQEMSASIADGARAIVVARLDAAARFHAGDEIELAVDVRRLHFFDLETGRAIDV